MNRLSIYPKIFLQKNPEVYTPGSNSLKCIVTVYYFAFDFSFNSSLSLSDGFQTFISESFVIFDPGRI